MSAAKTIIYNVYGNFECEASKSKCRGLLQVTCKTAKVTGYPEQIV